MRCPSCHRAMLSTSSQAIEDGEGAMTVTGWRCRPCHETVEKIWLSGRYRGPALQPIRYAVKAEDRAASVGLVRERDCYAGAV